MLLAMPVASGFDSEVFATLAWSLCRGSGVEAVDGNVLHIEIYMYK